jgi:hypothetical protein
MSNADFDALLTRNIVFLCLKDCSAVNTVIECMARSTPLVVNRHPALEELLGKDYPGFYDDLEGAAAIAMSRRAIALCNAFMRDRVDKSTLCLEAFVAGVRNAVGEVVGIRGGRGKQRAAPLTGCKCS